jgi:alanine racemase
VARLSEVAAGTGVGYGHEYQCARKSVIALVPIGYGDGLSRSLGNGRGQVLVRGCFAPIVGRVSMDQITVDVTDVAGTAIHDDVVIIGSQGEIAQSAEDLASATGTISYEVLSRLLPRVPRLFVQGGSVVSSVY